MAKFEGSATLSKKEGDTSINVSLGRKGFFERAKEEREKRIADMKKVCCNCGKFIDKPVALCSQPDPFMKCAHKVLQKLVPGINVLCEECAKKCKKCGKYFCPTHLKKHKCI